MLTQQQLHLKNAGFSPSDEVNAERLRCLERCWVGPESLLAAMPQVTPESVRSYVASAFSSGVQLVAYVGGNVGRQEAISIYDTATAALGHPAPLVPLPPLGVCAALPRG